MQRFPDWSQRLRRAIETKRNLGRAWGSNDCAICTADFVHAQTGVDFAADYRGRYSDEEGAYALLKQLGYADLPALVDARLPRRAGRAQRGDVLWHPGVFGNFLGTAWSAGVVAPGPDRLMVHPLRTPLIVWAVA